MGDDWAQEAAKKYREKFAGKQLEDDKLVATEVIKKRESPKLFKELLGVADEKCNQFNISAERAPVLSVVKGGGFQCFSIAAQLTARESNNLRFSVDESSIQVNSTGSQSFSYRLEVLPDGRLVPLEGATRISLVQIIEKGIDKLFE